jgi:hypothetical protein
VEDAVVIDAVFPDESLDPGILRNSLVAAVSEFVAGMGAKYIDVILKIWRTLYLVLQNKSYIILEDGQ